MLPGPPGEGPARELVAESRPTGVPGTPASTIADADRRDLYGEGGIQDFRALTQDVSRSVASRTLVPGSSRAALSIWLVSTSSRPSIMSAIRAGRRGAI